MPSRAALWLYRVDLFLSVMVHLWLGLFLFFLPWTPWWTHNRLFLYFVPLAHFTQNGAVRGVVSGLGLLNLWVALVETVRPREN
jgi:hypothetical protein